MRFEFYDTGLADIPRLSVDGIVPNSIHFSHWQGNETVPQLRADTSTEIALNLVAAPNQEELTRGIELVTNNHFDTDGVLSVWTVLTGERALQLREQLIPAAEAGDFSELTNEQAVRASIAIQGSDQPVGEDKSMPLVCHLAGEDVNDEARAYELILPEVERLLTRTDEYEQFWRGPWEKIVTALASFERGASQVTEFAAAHISLVTLAPEVFGPGGFDPVRQAAPFTAITRYARGRLFLIATPLKDGWAYRVDYPYYSWAETVVRPRIPRRDFSQLLQRLDQLEPAGRGAWKADTSELSSAFKFFGTDGKLAASRLKPDDVVKYVSESLDNS
jgi:Family of unknown function (DUF6687)